MRLLVSMRPIFTLFSGNFLGAAAGGVFFLMASWSFDLAEMGRYSIAISAQWIAFGLGGTGLSVATVRLAADRLGVGDRAAACGVVAMAATTAVAISLCAAGLCVWLVPLVAHRAALPREAMVLVALWAGARALLDCTRSALLVQQQFTRVMFLVWLSAATGLASLAVVALSGPLTVERLLLAHVAGLGTSAVAGLTLLAPLAREGIRVPARLLRELLEYARWPALSEGTRLLQVHLGPLALVALAGSEQAGLFSLGRYPAYLFDVVAVSLYQYWLPTAVQAGTPAMLAGFLARQLRFAAWLGLGMCAAALAIQPVLPMLGENFAAGAPLFVLNAIDFALLLLLRPVEASFHGLHRPRLELKLRMVALPLLIAVAIPLVSHFGARGMVWAHVLTGAVALPLGLRLLRGALDSSLKVGAGAQARRR